MAGPVTEDLPELLGRLAVAEAKIKLCLEHPLLRGIDSKAARGAMGALSYIRDRLLRGDVDGQERPPFGIERSLPEGDRD